MFCITFIVGINGVSLKQSVSIKSDAKELAELALKIWSLKPAILKRVNPFLICELIDKCCHGENRARATLLMSQEPRTDFDNLYGELMKMCVNSSTAEKVDQTCSAVIKSQLSEHMVKDDHAIHQYLDIISEHQDDMLMLPHWIRRSCEIKHFQAFMCLSNTKLVEECATEVLQMALDDDYVDYATLIMKIKQVLNEIIAKLLKKFPTMAMKKKLF